MTRPSSRMPLSILALLILALLASIPLKLGGAQYMVWDMDILPVISRGAEFLTGGQFPAVGTLSSVAAYNMPLLVWLHLPALTLVEDPWLAMLLTQLSFNLISSCYAYLLGSLLFTRWVGLASALIFTFTETVIAGSFTAWAQFLLPGFGLMVMVHLWLWRLKESGVHLAVAGVLAVAAFMTHFAAIMLFPAMLAFAIFTGVRWQWRGLLAGIVMSFALLAPYIAVQFQRDFVDLRAFFTREVTVPDAVAEYEYLKPGAPQPRTSAPANTEPVMLIAQTNPTPQNRVIAFIQDLPQQIINGLGLFNTLFPFTPPTNTPEPLQSFAWDTMMGTRLISWFGQLAALGIVLWRLAQRHPLTVTLTQTTAGRITVLSGFCMIIILGLIGTRALPFGQPTYYHTLLGVHWVVFIAVVSWGLGHIQRRLLPLTLIAGIIITGFYASDYTLRLLRRDPDTYTTGRAWLYQDIDAATAYIAGDAVRDQITVSYDIMPEMRNLWWVPAWHSVDPTYRLGAPYDFLLTYHHGVTNTNRDPIGLVDDADYIVTLTPALSRYDLTQYDSQQFGVIVVLKPQS